MAWTVTTTIDKIYNIVHPMGSEMIVIKLDCTSDASSTSVDLVATLKAIEPVGFWWEKLRGRWMYGILYIPDGVDTPTTAPSIDLTGTDGYSWIDEDAMTVDANAFVPGSDESGVFPPLEDGATFASTTLANTKKAAFYLYILRG